MRSIKVKHNGKLHKKIVSAVRERIKASATTHTDRSNDWKKMEELFVGYLPEKEADRLRRLQREGGNPDYTTIQLPYSYAVAIAAANYFTSVFLSRSPVFQYSGFKGEGEDQVLAIEAIQNYQLYKSRQLANLFIWLQDVAKYGEAWIVPYWKVDQAVVSEFALQDKVIEGVTDPTEQELIRKTRVVEKYKGNCLHNVHPARVYTDPRHSRINYQMGEFVAVETELSMNKLIMGEKQGQYINVENLPKTGAHKDNWDETKQDSAAPILETPDIQDFSTSNDPKASDVFKVYEMTIEIVPEKWGIGKMDMPEKWVFTVTADYSTVVECRPLGYIHNKFPLVLIQAEMENYARFARSLMEIYGPVQETLDWLVNSHFFNVRQTLNNQFVLDPSRVYEKDLERKEPGLNIRLKPAAYGTDARTAIHQLQVADVTGTHLNDMEMLYRLGERLGISDPVMGMSHPSSRRTAQEIRGNQTFSVGRLRTMTEWFSCTGWDDLSSILVSNTQQFYTGEEKFRIAGETALLAGEQFLTVTPEDIAGEFMFEPVDGTLPVDRFAQVNLWRELLTNMYQVPQVVQQYDLGKIFGYVAQLGGIKNLNRFKVQVMPDGAMQAQAQAGNAVPMQPAANPLEPGQISGVGPTA